VENDVIAERTSHKNKKGRSFHCACRKMLPSGGALYDRRRREEPAGLVSPDCIAHPGRLACNQKLGERENPRPPREGGAHLRVAEPFYEKSFYGEPSLSLCVGLCSF